MTSRAAWRLEFISALGIVVWWRLKGGVYLGLGGLRGVPRGMIEAKIPRRVPPALAWYKSSVNFLPPINQKRTSAIACSVHDRPLYIYLIIELLWKIYVKRLFEGGMYSSVTASNRHRT